MTACPDKELALHALIDGELDALSAAGLEEHLRSCQSCREELDRLEALHSMLGNTDLGYPAPAALRERIIDQTIGQSRPSGATPWQAWAGGGAIGALAASLALFFVMPQLAGPDLAGELVDSHIRSLQATHLTDVLTSDRHVVKPWFNGRLDFSPPVVDLAAQGFPLVGGRLDVIDRHSVAVLVYRRRLHSINLFIRPAPRQGAKSDTGLHRDSYNLVRWISGGLEFWAVSDIDAQELSLFRNSFIAAAPRVVSNERGFHREYDE